MNAVGRRLIEPARQLGLEELAAAWFGVAIEATLPGYGALAGEMEMFRKLRGALGASLLRSASPEARNNRPCPWQPPCALDLLFREQARGGGGRGVPKPWVLAADRVGKDLVVRLTLFGFATEWAPAISAALAEALVYGVEWRLLRRDLFKPRPEISALRLLEIQGKATTTVPDAALVTFVSPLEAEMTDLREAPWSLLTRAARRVQMLAAWMDAGLSDSVEEIAAKARELSYDAGGVEALPVDRRSGRGGQAFQQLMHSGSLHLGGDLGSIWPLLRIMAFCHVGRGTTAGFGRVSVVAT
ncbi:MAG: CRISPR system precrRNA processing endoribonuclease RAMP protein Cas6 [Aquidulcibacter sp.]|jgi:hypothetical protein